MGARASSADKSLGDAQKARQAIVPSAPSASKDASSRSILPDGFWGHNIYACVTDPSDILEAEAEYEFALAQTRRAQEHPVAPTAVPAPAAAAATAAAPAPTAAAEVAKASAKELGELVPRRGICGVCWKQLASLACKECLVEHYCGIACATLDAPRHAVACERICDMRNQLAELRRVATQRPSVR